VESSLRPSPEPRRARGSLAVLLTSLIVAGIWWGLSRARDSIVVPPLPSPPEGSEERPLSPPSRLRIPAIQVDAPVLPVGLMADQTMDIPEFATDIGWFSLGTVPGGTGSAVMAGHLDTVNDTPGVFWNLHELQVGDDIYVDAADGRTLHFKVRQKESYPVDEAPMERIFATQTGVFLNLVTCNGPWKGFTYANRLVVYTELVSDGIRADL